MTKEIRKSSEARKKLLQGVNTLADAVGATMGPKGRNVMIDKSYGAPKITKDGVTVAKEIAELKDPYENMGAKAVKEAASKAAEDVGDGTTTATVLTQAIATEGNKLVEAGLNPMDLKRGIDKVTSIIVQKIKERSIEVTSDNDIKNIAVVSANGDETTGELISEAITKVGKDGVITVEESKTTETSVEIVEGMQFDKGYVSPYMVTNPDKMICEFDNPLYLLYDGKLSNLNAVVPVLEGCSQSGRSLVIIAEDFDDTITSTVVVNKFRGGFKCVLVKSPAFGDRKKAILEDIAILTRGQVISAALGTDIENISMDMLGTSEKVKVGKDKTTIIKGAGDKTEIDARCASIDAEIEQTVSEYDKSKMRERKAALQGGVGVIRVGGSSDIEVKEKKDRVDDALGATRAAYEEGVVVGGGFTLAHIAKDLENSLPKAANADEEAGMKLMLRAITKPAEVILQNAGEKADYILGKVLEMKDTAGYDSRKGEYVEDMAKAGIIDPAKVTRIAVETAASIAGLLITTEVAIVEEKEEKCNCGHNHAPMMG